MRKKRLISLILFVVFFLIFSSQAQAEFDIISGDIVANCELVGDLYFIDYTINSEAYSILGLFPLSYEIQVSSSSVTSSIVGYFSTGPQGKVSIAGFIEADCDTYTITGRLYWPDFPYLPDFPLSSITIECECFIAGEEGCSAGFWKNHKKDWLTTVHTFFDDFDTTFGVDYFDPDITLYDALWARGGGVRKVARHGTAALLNASSSEVDYGYSIDEIIQAVQNGDVNSLVDYNELSTPGFCD